MPDFQVFDLGRAYAQAEAVRGGQQDREYRGLQIQAARNALNTPQKKSYEDTLNESRLLAAAFSAIGRDPTDDNVRRQGATLEAAGAKPQDFDKILAMPLDQRSREAPQQAAQLQEYIKNAMPPEKGDSGIGNVDPAKYTPESMAEFAKTKNFGVLVPRKPEGTDGPSAIQEYEYFNTLSPEAQRRYLEVKRNPAFSIQSIAGVPTGVATLPGGGVQTTPLSTQPAEFQAAAGKVGAETTARGSAETAAKAQADLPRIETNAQSMLNTLQALETSPGFEWVYGLKSLAPVVPGTEQANAIAVFEQLQGQAFLKAYETLKGGGQITQVEGEKATAAITTLSNRKQSPIAARKAIKELREVVNSALTRARKQATITPSAPAEQGIVQYDYDPERGLVPRQ